METSNGTVDDDMGSGWLQVKKKHRSSSKSSVQGWVGGSSGKHFSQENQSSTQVEGRNLNGKRAPNVPKVRAVSKLQSKEDLVAVTKRVLEDVGVGCQYDKPDIKQSGDSSHMPMPLAKECAFQDDCSMEVPQKVKFDIGRTIKWGDLDDDFVLLPGGNGEVGNKLCGNDHHTLVLPATPNVIERIDSDDTTGKLVGNKTVDPADPLSRTESQVIQLTVASEDVGIDIKQVLSLGTEDEPSREMIQQIKEISSMGIYPIAGAEVLDHDKKHNHPELVKPISVNMPDPSFSSVEVTESIQEPDSVKREVSASVILDEQRAGKDSSQVSEVCSVSNGSDSLRDTPATPSIEENNPTTDDQINEDVQKVNTTTSNTGDDSASESKERFRQRLWCFLFENLNRAVDELYLLCELECDVQQMREAIIVLEEATSDFKELNVRVQGFENIKRPSPQGVDGLPLTLKSDHRRPHALSWEVRRMSTSPHRAEILSSSLEAFEKFQKERNASYSTNHMREISPYYYAGHSDSNDIVRTSNVTSNMGPDSFESEVESKKQKRVSNVTKGTMTSERKNIGMGKAYDLNVAHGTLLPPKGSSLSTRGGPKSVSMSGKAITDPSMEKNIRFVDPCKVNSTHFDREREKRNSSSWKSMDAWKEKRNWEDILSSSFRGSSRASTLSMSRKSAERARVLHDKLMSPDKRRKTAVDVKKEAEEKHARALRIRSELETERVQKLQRSSEKLNRVNEWQADRSTKLKEVMNARHQRSVSRHEAFLAQIVRRAGDESSKVNEVRFITSLNEENKKLVLRQKLHGSELRRAEKLQVIKTKQKEDMAREEAVLERRKVIEAEKLQRLAEIQRRKEEAQLRREEERKASSAAREAKAIEQQRKKEIRAKAQQEEAELLAQKLAERLAESEQRRKIYLEQIRERASMDFRDQSSPLVRRSLSKENQGRNSTPTNNSDDVQSNIISGISSSTLVNGNVVFQSSMKRRIKKIRQRLMAQKHEIPEPLLYNENIGIGYRTAVGTARAKIGRWLQELQRLRQARKEGAEAIGLIIADIIKFVEGKEPELHACRQAGLLDFIASALPASHSSKPEACSVTVQFLKLLKVVLFLPANKSYFVAQNLLPPIIPMLAAAVENYTKIAASVNVPGGSPPLSGRTTVESLESVSEVLDGFLWIVTVVIGFSGSDECQIQMQDELLELVAAYQVIHRLRDLFALYDRPQMEGSPFPSSIILSINLLDVLTSRSKSKSSVNLDMSFVEPLTEENDLAKLAQCDERGTSRAVNSGVCGPPLPVVSSSTLMTVHVAPKTSYEEDVVWGDAEGSTFIAATEAPSDGTEKKVDNVKATEPQKGMTVSTYATAGSKKENIPGMKPPTTVLLSVISETGLVSLPSLLAAILLQGNNKQSYEQNSYVLPSNFEEVATGVLKVLINLALVDITFLQRMLSRPDLKMEFFHLMGFLLSHCTSNWKIATDQVGLLLVESLSLLGYFSLFHPGNQAVLRWGKSPTILHKVCDLPFVFFSDPKLMPVLAGALIASCYGCEQNKVVVQLELSVDMVISLLKSCKNDLPEAKGSNPKSGIEDSQKPPVDSSLRQSRSGGKNSRLSIGKNTTLGNINRVGKMKNQKEGKGFKSSEDFSQKQKSPPSSSPLMLHRRFPDSFLEKAEQFFSVDISEEF